MSKNKEISVSELVGKGYKDFWECEKRYRVLKGSRGSKKSVTCSIEYIYKMMYYYHQHKVKPNLLVVRATRNTLKDSCFAELKKAMIRLNVSHLWKINKSDLTMTYIESGQQILFRGLDDPLKITSITVENGNLCWVWWEEAFEIKAEEDFNKVDLSIRGELPFPLYKQHTLTLNPLTT